MTAEHLELSRYAGRWYEIAGIPQSREKGYLNVTADYVLQPDGRMKVTESYVAGGKIKKTEAVATVIDKANHSKLKVKSGWSSDDYWIFFVDPDYATALAGTPDLKSLRVLARRPGISGQQYEALLHLASDKGFDTSRVRRTQQNETD
jgi:apolipoprotein D and lipocalin family protein